MGFILGMTIGSIFGVVIMALLCANKEDQRGE